MPNRYLRNVPTYTYYVRNRNKIDPCNFTIFQPYRQFVAAIHFPFSAGFCWKCKAKSTVDGSVRFSRIIRRMRTTVSLQGSVRKDISHYFLLVHTHHIYHETYSSHQTSQEIVIFDLFLLDTCLIFIINFL